MHVKALLVSVMAVLLGLSGVATAYAGSGSYRLAQISMPDGTIQTPRWDPCQARITYKVNVSQIQGRKARWHAVRATKISAARVASATGMRFSYQGRTNRIPKEGNLSTQNMAEIVVAFVKPSATSYSLAGSTVGQGGWSASYSRINGSYVAAISRGFVVIDEPQTQHWRNGRHKTGVTRINLVSHELGHAVGLEHSSNPSDLMYPALQARTPAGFASQERYGLARLGRAAGCIDAGSMLRDL